MNYSYMKARIKMINTKKNIVYGAFSYCYLDWQENRQTTFVLRRCGIARICEMKEPG